MQDFTVQIHLRTHNVATAYDIAAALQDFAENETDAPGAFQSGVIVKGNRITSADVEQDNDISELADETYIDPRL